MYIVIYIVFGIIKYSESNTNVEQVKIWIWYSVNKVPVWHPACNMVHGTQHVHRYNTQLAIRFTVHNMCTGMAPSLQYGSQYTTYAPVQHPACNMVHSTQHMHRYSTQLAIWFTVHNMCSVNKVRVRHPACQLHCTSLSSEIHNISTRTTIAQTGSNGCHTGMATGCQQHLQ